MAANNPGKLSRFFTTGKPQLAGQPIPHGTVTDKGMSDLAPQRIFSQGWRRDQTMRAHSVGQYGYLHRKRRGNFPYIVDRRQPARQNADPSPPVREITRNTI
jgi:hypothetical protein